MTLLEILVVLALLGIVAALGVMGWRTLLQREQARSALASVQQALWQGATAASARGADLVLRWDGDELLLVDASDRELRRWDFPADTSTTLQQGDIVAFTPPGMIEDLEALPDPFSVSVDDRTAVLAVSLIGETKVTW